MDALEAIYSRRSIRRYTGEPVPNEMIQELLKAAMSAPSAGNEQPWEFVVITEREMLNRIPSIHPYSQMLKEAPAAILVCGNEQREKYSGYWVQDCSAATENLLIAARALGLGTVWLGVYPLEERVKGLRLLLGIPEHITPFSLVSFGFPAEEKPPSNRFDNTRIHYDHWGK